VNKSILFGDSYGELALFDESGNLTASLNATSGSGGDLGLSNTLGNLTARMYGTTTAGGGMALYNAIHELRILATGGSDGGLQTWYNLGSPAISFEADLPGDASANFPDDAINSDEIVNEPGITVEDNSTIHDLTSTTMQDIETVTITIPRAGYIVVTAKAWGYHTGTTGSAYSAAQIDETSGGGTLVPYYTRWGSTSLPSGTHYESIYVHRVYNKAAGTYTFRLEAAQVSTSTGASHRIADPILIATYYPTSYGSVNTFVSSSEAGQFDNVEYTASSRQNGDETEYIENNVKVDLRELELKAEKLRKELRRTEMEIRDRQHREQLEAENNTRRTDE